MKLLLATNNPAKVREYLALLGDLPLTLTTLAEERVALELEETGRTLEENATLKAKTYAQISGLLTLADDSGLEVEALGGAPGPLSRRFAGEGASDRERIDLLLSKLAGIPWERREARFLCVIAIARPQGEIELCRGQCAGIIALEPKGEFGFGYDPIFYLPEKDLTMAQLPLEEKNQVSHRAQAARRARPILEGLGRRGEG